MYHIGLLPGRRCGTFFTENISDTFLSLIRHFATCFVLKNVKRKKRREEDAIEGKKKRRKELTKSNRCFILITSEHLFFMKETDYGKR